MSISLLIIGTATTSGHHALYRTIQEEEHHTAELSCELVGTVEKNESPEIITISQTKLQKYEQEQQLQKTTG